MNSCEYFVPIKGFEGLYEVGNLGTVRSVERTITYKDKRIYRYLGHVVACGDNGHGYLFVNLWRDNQPKRFYIHRLVAEHFLPNPQMKPQVNHKDEDKRNNKVDNLEWCTESENVNYGTAIQRSVKKQGYSVKLISESGEEFNFPSISKAAQFCGVSKGMANYAYHKKRLLSGMQIVYE